MNYPDDYQNTNDKVVEKRYKLKNTQLKNGQYCHDSPDSIVEIPHFTEAFSWYFFEILGETQTSVTSRIKEANPFPFDTTRLNEVIKYSKPWKLKYVEFLKKLAGVSWTDILFFYEHQEIYNAENREFVNYARKMLGDKQNNQEIINMFSLPNSMKLDNITDVELLRPIAGTYYAYFSTTDNSHIKPKADHYVSGVINSGIFTIDLPAEKHSGLCGATINFKEKLTNGKNKSYQGSLLVSHRYPEFAFVTLLGDTSSVFQKNSEIVYMILQRTEETDTSFLYGLVLTISSASDTKRPCAERIYLTNEKIEENTDRYNILCAQLRMNDETIRIGPVGFEPIKEMLKHSPYPHLQEFISSFPEPALWKIGIDKNLSSTQDTLFIDADAIFNGNTSPEEKMLNGFTNNEKLLLEAILRSHSTDRWTHRTQIDQGKNINDPNVNH